MPPFVAISGSLAHVEESDINTLQTPLQPSGLSLHHGNSLILKPL
ncbi:hypothetical protein OAT22_01095 [Porticoccaceae bacterium]|nr:hypothetical protein [Porticoccaceae bacterium]